MALKKLLFAALALAACGPTKHRSSNSPIPNENSADENQDPDPDSASAQTAASGGGGSGSGSSTTPTPDQDLELGYKFDLLGTLEFDMTKGYSDTAINVDDYKEVVVVWTNVDQEFLAHRLTGIGGTPTTDAAQKFRLNMDASQYHFMQGETDLENNLVCVFAHEAQGEFFESDQLPNFALWQPGSAVRSRRIRVDGRFLSVGLRAPRNGQLVSMHYPYNGYYYSISGLHPIFKVFGVRD